MWQSRPRFRRQVVTRGACGSLPSQTRIGCSGGLLPRSSSFFRWAIIERCHDSSHPQGIRQWTECGSRCLIGDIGFLDHRRSENGALAIGHFRVPKSERLEELRRALLELSPAEKSPPNPGDSPVPPFLNSQCSAILSPPLFFSPIQIEVTLCFSSELLIKASFLKNLMSD